MVILALIAARRGDRAALSHARCGIDGVAFSYKQHLLGKASGRVIVDDEVSGSRSV